MCLYRNNEKVTEDLLENAFKLRDTIILHKKDKTPIKLVKEKIYNYTLDNQDTVIPIEGIKSVVEFLKQNNFCSINKGGNVAGKYIGLKTSILYGKFGFHLPHCPRYFGRSRNDYWRYF